MRNTHSLIQVKCLFHGKSMVVLPPCAEPPALMEGTQVPWCIVHDHGCTPEPGLLRVSVWWQTSISSKFCLKSDTDILQEREANYSQRFFPSHQTDRGFWSVFVAAHVSFDARHQQRTRTLHPRDSLSAAFSAPQCSQCSTLGCTNRKWQKQLAFRPKFNTFIAEVIFFHWQKNKFFFFFFPTLSYHSKAPPTLCCPRGFGVAPNPRHREPSSPGGGKKKSEKVHCRAEGNVKYKSSLT